MRMRTTWAVLGSLLVTLMLGLVIAGVSSAAPSARAAEPQRCAGASPAVQAKPSPARPAPAARSRHGYLVEARMGWAIG